MNCIFCEGIKEHQVLLETENYRVLFDIDPIQTGHLLIMTKSHFKSIIDLSDKLLIELFMIQKQLTTILEKNFHVDGVSIIQNNGEIMDEGTHFHVHIVPRYHDDQFWEHQQVIERPLLTNELAKHLKMLAHTI